jgi:hypothetical protein
MIKKSIICFVVLAVLHLCFVLANPSMGMATHQWQDNVMKAQQFLYAGKTDTVMVGTSLSGRIIRDSIPFVKSVSFGGCSVEDGLKIILNKKDVPKLVLVETNLLLIDGNPELVSRITNGVIPKIRHWIPSLREQYEPISLFASLMMNSTGINPQAGMAKVDMNLLNESINRHIAEDRLMPEEWIKRRGETIKALIAGLESKGARFVFFEMPVNERLLHLKKNDQMRAFVKKEFPTSKYLYLPSDTFKYLTTDGEHLDFEGQQRFSHYFRKVLEDVTM